jgi:hypothetical protein
MADATDDDAIPYEFSHEPLTKEQLDEVAIHVFQKKLRELSNELETITKEKKRDEDNFTKLAEIHYAKRQSMTDKQKEIEREIKRTRDRLYRFRHHDELREKKRQYDTKRKAMKEIEKSS